MFNKSKKILLTLALGSLFVSQNGFADISLMEKLDGDMYDTTNTTSVSARLNTFTGNLDGTASFTNASSDNIKTKANNLGLLIVEGDLSSTSHLSSKIKSIGKFINNADPITATPLKSQVDNLGLLMNAGALSLTAGSVVTLESKVHDLGKNIDGAVASTSSTLSAKESALGLLMSTGALDPSNPTAANVVTLTTKVKDLGNLINGSDPSSTNTLSAKIGSKADAVGTLTTGLFGDNDSVFSMVGAIYEKVAGTGTWATLTGDANAAPTTVKAALEALVARVNG